MADTMTHRGPDQAGAFVNERIALGHRRLKIIDLSDEGGQPMSDAQNRAVLVFNGEIYNYRELRQELIERGYAFRTQTDTEVVLNCFLEHGIECLERFIGMFAFAVHDRRSHKTYVVRDRIGIKPLFHARVQGQLVFASEIKAILAHPGVRRVANPVGISSYLSYRYPIEDHTLFEGIAQLRPGHYLEIDGANVADRRYWDLPVVSRRADPGESELLERTLELLQSAVRYRMIADVPVGAYLSGGLDSSAVVSLMAESAQAPVKTFSIGFEEKGYDEFAYARQVADRCDTDHHEIRLSAQAYLDNMRQLIRYKDSPLGVPNEPALYAMSKELKKHITVVLSGEGADEIFGGYGRIFRSADDYERLQALAEGSDVELRSNLRAKYGDRSFRRPVDHFLSLYRYLGPEEKEGLLTPEFLDAAGRDAPLDAVFEDYFDRVRELDLVDRYMWLFEKVHIVGLLQRVDVTTMATSVEARVPFVDHRLVELALAMPAHYKLRWRSPEDRSTASTKNADQISEVHDTTKYILRKALASRLPPDVIERQKMGFPAPLHLWFGGDLNGVARDHLLDAQARSRGIYDVSAIERLLDDSASFSEHHAGRRIWMLLNLELWFREFIDGGSK